MMRAERGRHFDPVLLDAFLEVLDSSGPDAREQVRTDPIAVADGALETFVTALRAATRRWPRARSRRRSRTAIAAVGAARAR